MRIDEEIFRRLKLEINRALNRGISVATLAKESKVSATTIYSLVDGSRKYPHLDTMIKVGRRLNMHLTWAEGKVPYMPAKHRPNFEAWYRSN